MLIQIPRKSIFLQFFKKSLRAEYQRSNDRGYGAAERGDNVALDKCRNVDAAECGGHEDSRCNKAESAAIAGGATVLFVSHNIAQIRSMCQHVVWLEHGHVKMMGEAPDICDQYARE